MANTAASNRVNQKKAANRRRFWQIFSWILVAILGTALVAFLTGWNPFHAATPAIATTTETAPIVCPNCTTATPEVLVPTAVVATVPIVPTTNPITPVEWDTTCVEQSKLVGITLTPLAEGEFFACVYHGLRVNVNIPQGMYADVDKGQVFVVAGPMDVDGVPNLTLRPWDSGQVSELCAHLKDLATYGSQQTPVFTPTGLNFSCPAN